MRVPVNRIKRVDFEQLQAVITLNYAFANIYIFLHARTHPISMNVMLDRDFSCW